MRRQWCALRDAIRRLWAALRAAVGFPVSEYPAALGRPERATERRWTPIYGEGPDVLEEARAFRERQANNTGLEPAREMARRRALETARSWYRDLLDECEREAEDLKLRRLTERAARAVEDTDGKEGADG